MLTIHVCLVSCDYINPVPGIFPWRRSIFTFYTKKAEPRPLHRLRYYFPNYIYPEPPEQLPCERKLKYPEKTNDFGRALIDSFHTTSYDLTNERHLL